VTKEIIIRAQQRAWLERSVLQGYVRAYSDHLHRGRYAASTRHAYLCCVAHFAHWLRAERHSLTAVNKAAVERFVVEHLPRCDCPYPGSRVPHTVRAALAQLLGVLRAEGAIASASAPNTHLARELAGSMPTCAMLQDLR
jgi:integrase/recombinase XerD